MSSLLSEETMLSTFPHSLICDKNMESMAKVTAEFLNKLNKSSESLYIYSRIDNLEEKLLDILAKDLNVSWYSYDAPLEAKRTIIKRAFFVHKQLGTAGSMRSAFEGVFPNTEIIEWFNYGGTPHHYKIVTDYPVDSLSIIEFSKMTATQRCSSVLERIELRCSGTAKPSVGIGVSNIEIITIKTSKGLEENLDGAL